MRGQIVYIYAYDVAYEIHVQKARGLAGLSEFLEVRPDKTMPREFPLYKPLYLQKPPIELKTSIGTIQLIREAKVFSTGVISICLRIDFSGERLGDLQKYHAVHLDDGRALDAVAGELCDELRAALGPCLVKAAAQRGNPEAYTSFCFQDVGLAAGRSVQDWLEEHRREAAGLLTEESQFTKLSESEVSETIRYNYSYTTQDILVVDWNSALIVDPDGKPEDLLYILEIANMQLTEFQLYDQMLESFLERAYDDVEAYARKPPLLKGPGPILRRLKEMRMDLSKMSEELTNITKFFGDWHLARIYMACNERFHLKEWEGSLEGKLRTLDSLYDMLREEMNNRRMILLEVSIVLLFVVDLIALIGFK